MKLLAVVAIGVVALFGSPTTGAAKSELLTNSCQTILEGAEGSWKLVQFYQERAQEVGDKLGKASRSGRSTDFDKLDKEFARLAREQAEQMEIMANYAQIYSTFCK